MGQGTPGLRVSADQVARAVVASAKVFGADPLAAFADGAATSLRRPIVPAAIGLAEALDISFNRACRLLGIRDTTLHQARRRGGELYGAAVAAAEAAVRLGGSASATSAAVGGGVGVEPAPEPLAVPASSPTIASSREAERAAPVGPIARPTPLADPMPARATMAVDFRAEAIPPDTVSGRILERLKIGAWTTVALATVLDAKEMQVVQALNILAHQGLVDADTDPDKGPRARLWRLKGGADRA